MRTVQAIINEMGGMAALKKQPIRLENPPYMVLCIEYIGTGPRHLPLVSVAHYGEQNGDAMRDPDMVFEVGDPVFDAVTSDRSERCLMSWAPISFRNDYAGVNQEAVWEDDAGKVLVRPALVLDLRRFASMWDKNIEEQGFLRVANVARR